MFYLYLKFKLPEMDSSRGNILQRRIIIKVGTNDIVNVMLCYVTLRYVTSRRVTLRYVTLRYVMLCYVMLCYVMLCYVMLCYVMLEWCSVECRKTKTKVITLANHKEHTHYSEPIKTRSNYR